MPDAEAFERFIQNHIRGQWVTMGTNIVCSACLCLTFLSCSWAIARDLDAIRREMNEKHGVNQGNVISVDRPTTREDVIRDMLKKRGEIE